MAKYTELLSEYLERGGQLPAAFSQIEGFNDLFIGTYCDREIGFETPVLFEIKLNTRAELVVPLYVQQIAEITAGKTEWENPERTHKIEGGTNHIYGMQFHKTYDRPISGSHNMVSDESITRASKDDTYTDKDTYTDRKDVDSGLTAAEVIERRKYLESEHRNIIQDLLKEFEDLFMQVY